MSGEDIREKVIRGMECCMSGQPEGLGCDRVPCPYHDIEDCEGALHCDALALLKEQERAIKYQSDRLDELLDKQQPRVITLEELRRMHPVWASNTPPYLWLEINRDCINVVSHWVAWSDVKEMIYGIYPKYDPDNYGTTWRCWTGKPTEA